MPSYNSPSSFNGICLFKCLMSSCLLTWKLQLADQSFFLLNRTSIRSVCYLNNGEFEKDLREGNNVSGSPDKTSVSKKIRGVSFSKILLVMSFWLFSHNCHSRNLVVPPLTGSIVKFLAYLSGKHIKGWREGNKFKEKRLKVISGL